jgi:hypothetical protein
LDINATDKQITFLSGEYAKNERGYYEIKPGKGVESKLRFKIEK